MWADRRSFLGQVVLLAQEFAHNLGIANRASQSRGRWSPLLSTDFDSATPVSSHVLINNRITAQFNARGLKSIYDPALKKAFELGPDEFSLNLDGQQIRSSNLSLPKITNEISRLVYLFEAHPYQIRATYELKPGWTFISKQLAVTSSGPKRTVRVGGVEVIRTRLRGSISSVLIARSPWSSSRVLTKDYGVFVRFSDRTGMFMLVQNPFVNVQCEGNKFALDYSPDIDWQTNFAAFQSDRGCIGVYALTGREVPIELIPEWKWVRDEAAAQGATEDRAEIAGFMDCVRAFLLDNSTKSTKICVGWCMNDYQLDAAAPAGREEYKRIIHRAAELGCDDVLYSPSNSALSSEKADTDSWHWEHVLWLALGQKIRKNEWKPDSSSIPETVKEMLEYARSEQVKLVAYVYPDLPFSQNPEWLVYTHGRQFPADFASLGVSGLQDLVDSIPARFL